MHCISWTRLPPTQMCAPTFKSIMTQSQNTKAMLISGYSPMAYAAILALITLLNVQILTKIFLYMKFWFFAFCSYHKFQQVFRIKWMMNDHWWSTTIRSVGSLHFISIHSWWDSELQFRKSNIPYYSCWLPTYSMIFIMMTFPFLLYVRLILLWFSLFAFFFPFGILFSMGCNLLHSFCNSPMTKLIN
jgi:hypothetical protein